LSAAEEIEESVVLSQTVRDEIDQWIKKYPDDQKQSAVLQALTLVQRENGGWLTESLMNAVADYLDMPRIAVYEVATFYSMYELEKVGRFKIGVCNNISCMLSGSGELITYLQNKLNIKPGETTDDGVFTLKEVECLAACGRAPVLTINDHEYHDNVTHENADLLLEKLQKGAA